MTNRLQRDSNTSATNWKTQTYTVGLIGGIVFGLLSAYLYTRAAEEDVSRAGKAERISTGEVIGLGLALLAVVRQITELGRGPDKPSKRR